MRCHSTHIALAAVLAGFAARPHGASASDHQEAPATAEDPAADLGDFYAWPTDHETVVLAVTYAGYATPSAAPVYDANVLYRLHISNDGDAVAEHTIDVRFGDNAAGDWGVSVGGLPGGDMITGPVQQVLEGDAGSLVFAGLRDDPFFFDLEGLQDTLTTGDLSFDAGRDFAAFQNTNAIVVEVPIATIGGDSTALRLWATTARKPS